MLKVAILQYRPVAAVRTGYDTANINMAKILKKMGANSKIFSLGPTSSNAIIDGMIPQQVVRSISYPEEGMGVMRVLDFASLYLLGFKPTVKFMNRNMRLMKSVESFSPDIIIVGSIHLNEFLARYKNLHQNVRILTFTDSPKIITDSFNAIDQIALPKRVKSFVKMQLKKKYFEYNLGAFDKLMSLADGIVVPTEGYKNDVVKRVPSARKKIFVIPPVSVKKLPKARRVTSVKRAIFIGAVDFLPNAEAIDIIEKVISPRVPDVTFVISGKGAVAREKGNFVVLPGNTTLSEAMKGCDLCLAPLNVWGGIKTKIFSYLEYGIPVLGTPAALEGYPFVDRVNGLVEENVNRFPERIKELQNNPELLKMITRNTPSVLEPFLEESAVRDWKRVVRFLKVNDILQAKEEVRPYCKHIHTGTCGLG